jgi:O-antigen/teichoic acid export membrane protein
MILKQSRNIRNTIWNLANTLIYPLGFLGLTPFFINSLGEHLFGSWMLLNSIVFISVHVLHFGMGPSIAMYVAEARGKSDTLRLNRYYNSSINFTHALAFGVMLITLSVWLVAPEGLFKWNGILDSSDLKSAFVLTSALIGIKFYEQLFMGFFKGFEEYDTAAKFNMAQKITMLIGQAIVLMMGHGLAEVIAVSLVTNSILVLSQFFWSKGYLTDYQWSATFDSRIFSRLRHFGFWSWLQTIVSLLSFQLDRLVVAFALGTDIVGYYSIASMIANHLHIMFEAMVGWIFPAVSRILKERGDPKPLYYSVRSALVILALLGLTILYLIREPLFELWLGVEKFESVIPFIELFILFEIFYILTIAPKFYLNGISELKLITSLEVGYKSVGIAAMLLFFYFDRSATALIWGQIAAMMIMMPLEMGIVNQKVLKSKLLFESVTLIIPCFALFGALYMEDLAIQLLLGLIAVVSTYLGYIRHYRVDFKLLLE